MPKGVYQRTEKHIEIIRECHRTLEYRLKSSEWNKAYWENLTLEEREYRRNGLIDAMRRPEVRARSRAAHIKAWTESEEYRILHRKRVKEGMGSMSQEAKEQMWFGHSLALKGRPLPESQRLAIKEHHQTPQYKKRNLKMLKRYWSDGAVLARRSKTSKRLWQDSIYVAIQMRARKCKPNKIELYLQGMLDERLPNEWMFVGDGQLIIGGKCPDYANINGKKVLIELYGEYWHRNDNPQDKIDHYKRYGYDCIVIWESELKDIDAVVDKIRSLDPDCQVQEIQGE